MRPACSIGTRSGGESSGNCRHALHTIWRFDVSRRVKHDKRGPARIVGAFVRVKAFDNVLCAGVESAGPRIRVAYSDFTSNQALVSRAGGRRA